MLVANCKLLGKNSFRVELSTWLWTANCLSGMGHHSESDRVCSFAMLVIFLLHLFQRQGLSVGVGWPSPMRRGHGRILRASAVASRHDAAAGPTFCWEARANVCQRAMAGGAAEEALASVLTSERGGVVFVLLWAWGSKSPVAKRKTDFAQILRTSWVQISFSHCQSSHGKEWIILQAASKPVCS